MGHTLKNPQYKMMVRQIFDESHKECFMNSEEMENLLYG